jgi:activating signal cointegrator complex subunit 3
VLSAVRSLPRLLVSVKAQPVTRQILRITLHINCGFTWAHSLTESFWIWIGDSENDHIYHSEMLLLNKKQRGEEQILAFTIPIAEPLPAQYLVHVMNDRWVGLDEVHAVSFKHLILPNQHPPHTNLLDLVPLPLSALQNEAFEKLYSDKMTHFNPIQTQVFHCLYNTDCNVLLGAPTSSGKTIVAELSILRMLRPRFEGDHTRKKCVYIAPLKALARERIKDWSVKFGEKLGLMVYDFFMGVYMNR